MRTIETPLEPQVFGSGMVTFYQTTNGAGAGNMPTVTLKLLFKCPFQARKISDARYYAAAQAGAKMTRVIRCPRVRGLQPEGDIAILTEDTTQYRVEKVSFASTTSPESMDITLSAVKTKYVVQEDDSSDS